MTDLRNEAVLFPEEHKNRLLLVYKKMEKSMNTRVALISIAVEEAGDVEKLNRILHKYAGYIIGRMGIPYQKRGISLISLAVDAPEDVISAMTGKIGMLAGITSKALYAKLKEAGDEKTD